MKLVRKLLSHARVRKARKQLSSDPSPMTYVSLAREHAIEGGVREALRICEEGLTAFPGSVELARMAERIRHRQRERRMHDLKRVMRQAPRPAVWQELCEILLDSGQVGRAEECCLDWYDTTRDVEATLMLARIRVERFLADRNREEGLRAFETLDAAQYELPRDERPLQLRATLAARVGAWAEARQALAQLLEITPGDPGLEARFRTAEGRAASAPTIEHALREVERTGVLYEEDQEQERGPTTTRDVRPTLKALASQPGVQAALYVRGGTALVQGPRGATAERGARTVRTIVQSGRATARRLGLGSISEVMVESVRGDTLTLSAGELDAGAVWSDGKPSASVVKTLMDLAGLNAAIGQEVAT